MFIRPLPPCAKTGLAENWNWDDTHTWCGGLEPLIEANAPVDTKTLWHQAQVMTGQGMRLCIGAMSSNLLSRSDGIADIAAAYWILQQLNRFSVDPSAGRWIPLSHSRPLYAEA